MRNDFHDFEILSQGRVMLLLDALLEHHLSDETDEGAKDIEICNA